MNKYHLGLIVDEVKNFKKLQKEWSYEDLDDLIGHYIEGDVISSRKELIRVLKTLKQKLGIIVKIRTFGDYWVGRN